MACYPDPPVQICDPSTPFSTVVSPKPGRLFTINGVALSNAHRFAVNFMVNGKDGDVALHTDFRFDERKIVRNSRVNGRWEHEERHGDLPISLGVPFELMVMVERCRFMIAINGKHFTEFVHRAPLALIDTLTITGHVHVSIYRETNGGADMGMAVMLTRPLPLKYSAKSIFVYDLPGGLFNGRIIHLMGASRNGTFCYNFMPSNDSNEVGLHISCRVSEGGVVVLNSKENSNWQAEVRPPNLRFARNQHFIFEITNYAGEFRLLLNGVSMGSFPIRRYAPESLQVLNVTGEVDHRYAAST